MGQLLQAGRDRDAHGQPGWGEQQVLDGERPGNEARGETPASAQSYNPLTVSLPSRRYN